MQEQLEQHTSNDICSIFDEGYCEEESVMPNAADISSIFDEVYCEEESVMPNAAVEEMNKMDLTGSMQNTQPDEEPEEENLSTDNLYKNFEGKEKINNITEYL